MRYLVTSTYLGKEKRQVWDANEPMQLCRPFRWRLQRSANGSVLEALFVAEGAAQAECIDLSRMDEMKDHEAIELELSPGMQLRINRIVPITPPFAIAKEAGSDSVGGKPRELVKISRSQTGLFVFDGVKQVLINQEPVAKEYVGVTREKPVFTVREEDEHFQITALLSGVRVKLKGEAPVDFPVGESKLVARQDFLRTTITWGAHWWRFKQVEKPLPILEFDDGEGIESPASAKAENSFFYLMLLLALLVSAATVWISVQFPAQEKTLIRMDEERPHPIKVDMTRFLRESSKPKPAPVAEVPALPKPQAPEQPKAEAKGGGAAGGSGGKAKVAKAGPQNLAPGKAGAAPLGNPLANKAPSKEAARPAAGRSLPGPVDARAAAQRAEAKSAADAAAVKAAVENAAISRSGAILAQNSQALKDAFGSVAAAVSQPAAIGTGAAPVKGFSSKVVGLSGAASASAVLGGGGATTGSGTGVVGRDINIPTQATGTGEKVGKLTDTYGAVNGVPGGTGAGGAGGGLKGLGSEDAEGMGSGTGVGNGYGDGSGSGLGYGSSGESAALVKISTEKAAEEGLRKEEVIAVIRNHMGEVKHCHDFAILYHPNLEGRVVIDFTIGPSGMPSSVKEQSSTLPEKKLAPCLVSKIATWKFPRPRQGVPVQVSYPFIFKTLGGE